MKGSHSASTFAIRAAVIVLFAVAAGHLSALEIRSGLIKLSVDDMSGRAALYRLTEAGRNRYEALLFDMDARTSFPTLLMDSRYHRMGESPAFRYSLSRLPDGALITFTSATCAVRQRIELVSSEKSKPADTFRMSFEIENTGARVIRVGLRMLLDTWLGEDSGHHFATGTQPRLTEETRIAKSATEKWVSNFGELASLRIALEGDGITTPDEIVLANWKRMSDSDWSFEPGGLRGFSFAPFSINDSAVALFWYPANLAGGAIRNISFDLISLPGRAGLSRSGSEPAWTSSAPVTIARPMPAPEPVPEPATKAKIETKIGTEADAAELWALLAWIDECLADPESVSDALLDDLRKKLAVLRANFRPR